MKINIRRRNLGDNPASAMSDIAFLLIVFFMVIAVFTVKEGFSIKTPEKDKVVKKSSSDVFKIQIKNNDFFVADKPVEKENLKNEIINSRSSRLVILEIDGNSEYKEVIYALDIFYELKILDFSMKKI